MHRRTCYLRALTSLHHRHQIAPDGATCLHPHSRRRAVSRSRNHRRSQLIRCLPNPEDRRLDRNLPPILEPSLVERHADRRVAMIDRRLHRIHAPNQPVMPRQIDPIRQMNLRLRLRRHAVSSLHLARIQALVQLERELPPDCLAKVAVPDVGGVCAPAAIAPVIQASRQNPAAAPTTAFVLMLIEPSFSTLNRSTSLQHHRKKSIAAMHSRQRPQRAFPRGRLQLQSRKQNSLLRKLADHALHRNPAQTQLARHRIDHLLTLLRLQRARRVDQPAARSKPLQSALQNRPLPLRLPLQTPPASTGAESPDSPPASPSRCRAHRTESDRTSPRHSGHRVASATAHSTRSA